MEDGDGLPVVAAAPAQDVSAFVAQTVAAAFGVVAVCVELVLRAASRAAGPDPVGTDPGAVTAAKPVNVTTLTDATLGVGWTVVRIGGSVVTVAGRVGGTVVRPVVGVVASPPLLPRSVWPSTVVDQVSRSWRAQRPDSVAALGRMSRSVAPDAVDLAFELVDVDRVAGAVVDRLDVPAVVDRVLDRLDLDRIVAGVLARLDLDAVVSTALADLDLDRVVGDAVARVDIATLVEQVIAEIDLTALVTDRVDLGAVVDDALDQLDLTQLVMQRVDLATVAERVIDDIDLPEIIRESTGSIAYETVRGIRLQSVDADRAVERIVDRILLRRRARRTKAPQAPAQPAQADQPDQPDQPDRQADVDEQDGTPT
jgi:hypothetical protein